MLFPKNKMRFTTGYKDKTDPAGWIVLDLAGVDMEGATKVYLSVADLEKLRQAGDQASEKLKQARALLGGEPEA